MDFNTMVNLLIYLDELEEELFWYKLDKDYREHFEISFQQEMKNAEWKQAKLLQKKLLRELDKMCQM